MTPPRFNPEVVQPIDPRLVRWARGCVRRCIRAHTKATAEAALRPLWERVERSAKVADAAFVAIQRMRDLGELFEDEGACLLNEVYEYRHPLYISHDPEHQRLIEESLVDMHAADDGHPGEGWHDNAWHMARMSRRDAQLKAAFLRARGELRLAERVEEDDTELWGEIYDGELSLVLEKQPYPVIGPVDPPWVALLRERIAGVVTAETWSQTAEQQERVRQLLGEASAASGAEAVRQLFEVGMITRRQRQALMHTIAEGRTADAVEADRICRRLDQRRIENKDEEADRLYGRRWDRFLVYYLRRLGEHEMAEMVRRDPVEYEEVVSYTPVSEWMEALGRREE